MPSLDRTNRPPRPFSPLKIVLLYAAFGLAWIFLSDWLIYTLFDDETVQALMQSSKGGLFILVTSFFLGCLLNRASTEMASYRRKTEQSRSLLQGIVDGTSDIIFAKDLEGRYLLFNRAAEEFTGRSDDEVRGRDDRLLFRPEEVETLRESDRQVIDSASVINYDQDLTDGAGRKRILQTTKGPLKDERGQTVGTFGITRDISRLKEVEEDLEEKSELLEATFSSIDEAILVIQPQTRTVITANRAVESIFGYSLAEVIGQKTTFLHASRENYHEFGRMSEAYLERGEVFRKEWPMRKKDGATFWAEITVSAISPTQHWRQGVVSVVRDITRRKEADQELRRLNKILRVVSRCNEALVRAKSEQELLRTVLGHLVESGDYVLGWTGLLDEDGDKIRHFLRRPEADRLFRKMEASGCQTLQQLLRLCRQRSASALSLPDPFPACERCHHCRELMTLFSVRSVFSHPLVANGAHLGCLVLFSGAASFYPEEVALLKELGDDLAYGLRALRTEEAHRWARETLRLRNRAIEASTNGIMISEAKEPERALIYVNPAFEKITGYRSEEVLGRSPRFLLSTDHDQKDLVDLRAALDARRPARALLRNYRKDGSLFWNDLSVAPVRNDEGETTHFVGILNDVTERQLYEEELARASNYDALTGLANRNLLADRLHQGIAHARRSGRRLGLILLDLDRFQILNDSLGHSLGNELLQRVAERLETCVRSQDTLARLGGDEFVLLFTDIRDQSSLVTIVENIREVLEPSFALGNRHIQVTASIGISLFPEDGDEGEILLRNADIAMYRAKEEGRDAFHFFAPEMDTMVYETMDLEADLRRAVEKEEFILHFQPKVEVASGRIVGCEALVRWHHPERGMVSPGAFIPLAEVTGIIEPIGEWVLAEACRINKALQSEGLRPISVAVNISARQFRNEDLARMVEQRLRESGLEPRWLELELTETMIMNKPEQAAQIMARLKHLGIGLSLDDFGTGYSSLNYLRRFPVDTLKIDRSFIAEAHLDPGSASVANSVIDIAHNLGIKAIAEGVEEQEQLDFLRDCRCDIYQGFFFSRPVPADQFADLLRRDP